MAIQRPHTFKLLNVPKADLYFKELDVKTHMVQGKIKKPVARAGYHTFRSLAMAVQAVAFAVLTVVSQIDKSFKKLGSLIGRVAISFASMPMAARRVFFPKEAEIIQNRVDHLNELLKGAKYPTLEAVVGKGAKELNSTEKKELMDNWLKETLGDARHEPALKELCETLGQIADNDVTGDVLAQMEQRVKEICQGPKEKDGNQEKIAEAKAIRNRFPHLNWFTSTFIELFKVEREKEKEIKTSTIEKNFSLLIKHPNLLKRKEVLPLLNKAPLQLRSQIIKKKNQVMHRLLTKAQAEESKILSDLSKYLQVLSKDSLLEKYVSSAEKNYVSARIEKLKNATTILGASPSDQETNFKEKIKTFELIHLIQQEEQLTSAEKTLNERILINSDGDAIPGLVDQANQVVIEEAKMTRKIIQERIEKSLSALESVYVSPTNKNTAERVSMAKEAKLLVSLPDDNYLERASALVVKLHKLELNSLTTANHQASYTHINEIQQSLLELSTHRNNVTIGHEKGDPWLSLNRLVPVVERQQQRRDAFAKDVIRLSLEKKHECQLPLLLSKKDSRSTFKDATDHLKDTDSSAATTNPNARSNSVAASKVDVKLIKAAEEFVQSVEKKYLAAFKQRLFTFKEFSEEVKDGKPIEIFEDIQPSEDGLAPDFVKYAQSIDVTEAINTWHKQLQQIWIEHMPNTEQQAIFTITSKEKRLKKIKESFADWILETTGTKLTTDLAFEKILPLDTSKNEALALGKLKSHPTFQRGLKQDHGFKGYIKGIKEQLQTNEVPKVVPEGFDPKLVAQETNDIQPTEPFFQHPYIALYGDDQELEDFVSYMITLRENLVHKTVGIDQSIEWVTLLASDTHLKMLKDLKLIILSECQTIAFESVKAKKAVPLEIQRLLLDQYRLVDMAGRKSDLDFSRLNNLERSNFLSLFVSMIFAPGQPVTMTELERSYLMQFLSISKLPLQMVDDIKNLVRVGATSTLQIQKEFLEVGRELQKSIIGLEGLEESTLQKTFQQSSSIAGTTKDRKLLDAYRATSGQALSCHLLNDVCDYYIVEHDQGREAIARAILHAYDSAIETKDKQSVIKFVKEKIAEYDPKPIHESKLAPCVRFFYLDLLTRLDPNADITTEEAYLVFNQTLIGSKNVNQMLMGYAREITRLTFEADKLNKNNQKLPGKDFCRLLTCKIAYQKLKLEYFDDKIEFEGFLKVEIDALEYAIAAYAKLIQSWLKDETYLKELKVALDNTPKDDEFSYGLTKAVLKRGNSDSLKPTAVPGLIALGQSVTIDGVLGIVYDNGRQQVSLPAACQNHPSVRSLGIHYLPYTYDPKEKTYVYYTKVDGVDTPQIILKEVDGLPYIQKKLPVSFDGKKIKDLQFVPKESINLPIAALHRLGVKHFWQDGQSTLTGYDAEGQLVVIIKNNGTAWAPDWRIAKGEEHYRFITRADLQHKQAHPVLSRLLKSYNPNEILVDWEKETFLIPAIGLKLIKNSDGKAGNQWECKRKGMPKKILDIDSAATNYLILKNEKAEEKAAIVKKGIKEAKYRLQLDEDKRLSNLAKHVIKNHKEKIRKLKNQLAEITERTFLVSLPDAAYRQQAAQDVIKIIPHHLQEQFEAFLELSAYSFDVYPKALKFLSDQLSAISSNQLDNTASTPEEQKLNGQLLEAYQTLQQQYEKTCDRLLDVVIFNESSDERITTTDLTAALALTVKGLENENTTQEEMLQLIKEIAKYPLDKPLNESQLNLVNQAIISFDTKPAEDCESIQLKAYLNLMLFNHYKEEMSELAHSPLADKKEKVQAIEAAYGDTKATCEDCLDELKVILDSKMPLATEVFSIWRKSKLKIETLNPKDSVSTDITLDKPFKATVANEFRALAGQTLLERLHATDSVKAEQKETEKEISKNQMAIIKSFHKHSPDQVAGFYLEEMGRFNLDGLYAEFRTNKLNEKKLLDEGRSKEEIEKLQHEEPALYGLTKKDVEKIFNFLVDEKIITRRPEDHYYHLSSSTHAMSTFQPAKIRALLADLPLTNEGINQVSERLRSFLFRATQSGFKFSFKEGAEKTLDVKLVKEKEVHLEKFLHAESILNSEIKKLRKEGLKITLVDIKYALLSGDYKKFVINGKPIANQELVKLSNAMIRYLFHKTEVQHIENIQKAPHYGERNKIELLQTKRNYPVDLLLQEGLKENERNEQIMQRAFLAFEEDYGYRCNIMQIKMFRSLVLDTKHEEAIDAAQARMGFGKTALLPLLAIVRVAIERKLKDDAKHLVRYVVPPAVIEDNTGSFNQRLSAILGGNVVKDRNFARYQIDKDDPEHSFELMIQDLNERKMFYEEAKSWGDVLIQWPEIRCSMEAQDSDLGQMIVEEELSKTALAHCIKAKRLTGEVRSISTYTVFDELDDTQDIKSREVNFTRGDKKAIPHSTIRPLERLISYIDVNKTDDWKDLTARAEDLVRALCSNRDGAEITQCPKGLIDYLTNRNQKINPDTKAVLSDNLVKFIEGTSADSTHTENDSMIFLIRSILLDENVLAFAKSKQPSTHFGARFKEQDGQRIYYHDPDSQAALLIAVPYEGTNTPKGLSIFDNTEVAAITTMRYYLSKETPLEIKPHLDFLIKQMKNGKIPDELAKHYLGAVTTRAGKPILDLIRNMAGMLDLEELRSAKERFYGEFLKNPTEEFRKFFGMAVVTTQIRSDEACAKSDRYEKGSIRNVDKGCSGTVGGTSSYFAKQETDAAADGKMSIEIMGRDNNRKIELLTPPQPTNDYLEQIISTLLKSAFAKTSAIVDAAGMCKSRDGTPETVVKELWKQLKADSKFNHIEGIVYYGRDNVKRLYRGPNLLPISCNTNMELAAREGRKYFSFYGQKNTRGSDIKQPDGAHSLVTLDENVSNSDAKQAILRFRNLVNRDSEQTFSFAVMPSFESVLKETLKAEVELAIRDAERECSEYDKKDLNKEKKDAVQALKMQIKSLNKRLQAIALMGIKKSGKEQLQTKDIANYLRVQEKNIEQRVALTCYRNEMKAHIKQAAAHLEQDVLSQLPKDLNDDQTSAYVSFLKERNKISKFVEKSINTLYEKYGTATQDIERNKFIQSLKDETFQKLDTLFGIANKFAETTGVKVQLEKDFYKEHIDRSENFFKERYDVNTKVQIAHTNAEGEAIAQALAEAMAEAEAEGLAEKLAENVIAVDDRMHVPNFNMSRDPHLKPSLDFLTQATLRTALKDFEPMKNIVRPDFRNRFSVSPGLSGNQRLVAHFILKNLDNETYIFLTQQEADLFKKEIAHNPNKARGYTLHDARNLNKILQAGAEPLQLENEGVQQITCAILGDNKTPQQSVMSTEALRKISLVNVGSEQLLPSMTFKGDENLFDYYTLGNFGLTKDVDFSFRIQSLANRGAAPEVTIEVRTGCGSQKISIPKDNKWLNRFIPQAFRSDQPQKFVQVKTLIDAEYAKVEPQIKELERKLAALERVNAEDRRAIRDIKAFTLSEKMKKGQRDRDNQYYDDIFRSIGIKFITAMENILNAQNSLETDASISNLRNLKTLIDDFVSKETLDKVLTNGFSFKTTPLIDHDTWLEWEDNEFKGIKPLEMSYGRIFHKVHHSIFLGLSGAVDCSVDDCCCMFNETIPGIIQAIPSITKTLTQMENNEIERQKIVQEIEELRKKIQPLLDAKVVFDGDSQTGRLGVLAVQDRIESALHQQGYLTRKREFFDQFNLENFLSWNQEVNAQLKALMPDYRHVVEQDNEAYKKGIKALTAEEEKVRTNNMNFLKNVLQLAREIEDRSDEVNFVER